MKINTLCRRQNVVPMDSFPPLRRIHDGTDWPDIRVPEPTIAPEPAAAATPDDDTDGTLGLIRSCVEALGLLQAKCEALDTALTAVADDRERERAEGRQALAKVEAALAAAIERQASADQRADRADAEAREAARRFAEDLALARQEATTWRMRAETDGMAFEHLNARMTALEGGLSARLEEKTRALAASDARAEQALTRAAAGESHAARLEANLRGVEATIADQRSRIGCLQRKLATAAYAIEIDQMSRSLGGAAERDILDLRTTLGAAMISAA